MRKRSPTLFLALAVPAVRFADACVWQVGNGSSVLYLAGTVHKLSPDQYPLPPEYQWAYDNSDSLVFETDIGAMRTPALRDRVAARSLLPPGQTLGSVLDDSTYGMLRRYCEGTGFPVERLESLKPVAAMMTLLSATMQSLGVTAPGVDEHFFSLARADAKACRTLETVDQQIDYLMAMDEGRPDRFVRRSIQDLTQARDGALEEAIGAWRDGREDDMVERFLRDEMLSSPGLYQSLVVDRNRKWMHSLRRCLETSGAEMVLVGVGHLLGRDGLVALLRDEGYEVRKSSLH